MGKGKVFLHVGGPKTGTTAIQSALAQQQKQLQSLGFLYPGTEINQGYCFHPLRKIHGFGGYCSDDPGDWMRLCKQISEWNGDVILSFEALIAVPTEVIREIVDAIGGEQVEVVMTARSMSEIVVSQWQESVKAGDTTPLQDWAAEIALGPENATAKSFSYWIVVDYINPIRRWAEVVGIDKVTLQCVNVREPLETLRAFEKVCGLPVGTLRQPKDQLTNRSFTWGEVELIRFYNQILDQKIRGIEEYNSLSKETIDEILMRIPTVDECRIELPLMFYESVVAYAKSEIARIIGSSVKIVGNIDELTRVPAQRNDSRGCEIEVPLDAAKIIMKSIVRDKRFL